MDKISLKERIESLKYTIDRYDHYYDSVNNKTNLFLTLNTFLLGGIVTGFYSIRIQIADKSDILFFAWSGIILCIISIGFSLWATIPYLSRYGDSENGSLIYFGNVSNVSFQSFKQMYNVLTEEKLYEDYLQQAHLLAQGLQSKLSRLKIAVYTLGLCLICIIIIGFKILN